MSDWMFVLLCVGVLLGVVAATMRVSCVVFGPKIEELEMCVADLRQSLEAADRRETDLRKTVAELHEILGRAQSDAQKWKDKWYKAESHVERLSGVSARVEVVSGAPDPMREFVVQVDGGFEDVSMRPDEMNPHVDFVEVRARIGMDVRARMEGPVACAEVASRMAAQEVKKRVLDLAKDC